MIVLLRKYLACCLHSTKAVQPRAAHQHASPLNSFLWRGGDGKSLLSTVHWLTTPWRTGFSLFDGLTNNWLRLPWLHVWSVTTQIMMFVLSLQHTIFHIISHLEQPHRHVSYVTCNDVRRRVWLDVTASPHTRQAVLLWKHFSRRTCWLAA